MLWLRIWIESTLWLFLSSFFCEVYFKCLKIRRVQTMEVSITSKFSRETGGCLSDNNCMVWLPASSLRWLRHGLPAPTTPTCATWSICSFWTGHTRLSKTECNLRKKCLQQFRRILKNYVCFRSNTFPNLFDASVYFWETLRHSAHGWGATSCDRRLTQGGSCALGSLGSNGWILWAKLINYKVKLML